MASYKLATTTTSYILGCLTGSCATLAWKKDQHSSFQDRITENASKALYWTEKNLRDLDFTGQVPDKYRKGSLDMLLRPAGRFECLGSVYRICSWKSTFDWILREEDYETLRNRHIQIAFANSNIEEKNYEAFIAENAHDIKNIMEKVISDRVESTWNKIN